MGSVTNLWQEIFLQSEDFILTELYFYLTMTKTECLIESQLFKEIVQHFGKYAKSLSFWEWDVQIDIINLVSVLKV